MSDRSEQDDRRRAQFREAILMAYYERGDRIAELEEACEAALHWYGPDGDHISEPQRSQLLRALGKPGDFVGGDARDAYIAELEGEIAEHEEHLRSAMLGIGGADEAPCSRCLPLRAEIVRQGECIAELGAQLQSFRDFNAPLLKLAAEEGPGAWDCLQEDIDETE